MGLRVRTSNDVLFGIVCVFTNDGYNNKEWQIIQSSRADHPHYAWITPSFVPMIRYAAFVWNKRPKSTFLEVAAWIRSSIHCMSLVGQTRQSACDIVWPRATARNTTCTKTSQRNRTYTSLFSILHVIYLSLRNPSNWRASWFHK